MAHEIVVWMMNDPWNKGTLKNSLLKKLRSLMSTVPHKGWCKTMLVCTMTGKQNKKIYIFINVKYTCIAHHLLDKKTTYIFDLNIFKLQCYWKQVYISLIYFFPWKRCWQNKLKGQKKSTLASVKISKVFVSLLHNNRLEIKNKTLLSHHLSGTISLYILEHNNEPPFPLLVNNSTESSQNRSPIQL